MKRVAIIPARGGSKRLPRKNIKPFFGRPIIHYPITAAKVSGVFDEVIVSTDDTEIAAVATSAGATVLYRPAELADDHATTAAVIHHAVRCLMDHGAQLEQACCIYPCTPLIEPGDLKVGLDLLTIYKCCYAFSITNYDEPVQRMLRWADNGMVEAVWPQFENVRNQDLEPRYHDAGQWYWGTADAWLNEVPIFCKASVGIRLPRARAVDIDTDEDWLIAEAIFNARRKAP